MADSPSQHSSQKDIAAIAQDPTDNNDLNTSFQEQPTRRSMLRFSLFTLMAGVTGSALATDVANRAWTRHVTKDARETWKLIAENRTAMYPLNPSQINWHLIHMHDQLRLAGQPRSTVVNDSQYCETLRPHMKSLAYIARTEINAKDPVMECFRVKELCIPAVLADLPHSALVSEADLKQFAEQTAAFEMSQLVRLEPELSASAVYHRVQGLEELFLFTRYTPSELGVDLEQLFPM